MAAKTTLWYHLVFTTKYRRPVLNRATALLIEHAAEVTADHAHGELIAFNYGPDLAHVHILVCLPPTVPIASFCRDAKSMSSRLVHQMPDSFDRLTHLYAPRPAELDDLPGLWGRGYFAKTSGAGGLDAAQRYVAEQWQR